MTITLKAYESIVGRPVLAQLEELAENLPGIRVVHINSTRTGGGVAEILERLVPLMNELGIETSWEVIEGNEPFFEVTKSMHNGLQGNPVTLSPSARRAYEETNERNAQRLCPLLQGADFVFIHDPQPAALLKFCSNRRGLWFWRCHIDVSQPFRIVWKYLLPFVEGYDASIFSMAQFAQQLRHPQFLMRPSIDPLSEKNCELPPKELKEVQNRFGLDPSRPLLVQVSRFDRFKDPVGVIKAYQLVRKFCPAQLVLVGGSATDDPEGEAVLEEVNEAAKGDPDIHVILLPSDSHRTINALQRLADVILQKSTKEGFGLTVTEGLWKGKPVIGGNTGGIRLQVFDYHTGFLVDSPEGAAHRIRFLFQYPDKLRRMGEKGKEFVRENFLLTRHLREYLTLMLGLRQGLADHLIVE